jgi:hypothetical protein
MPDNSDLEREGVAATDLAFRKYLRWVFRDQPVDDYGIDAHVEPKRDGAPTGHLVALQIKAGRSWFRHKAENGWYYESSNDRHLKYWLRHILPVVVILYDPDSGVCYWQHVILENVTFTDSGWKLLVPASQALTADAAGSLVAIAESVPGASQDPFEAALGLLPPTTATALISASEVEPAGALRLAWLLADGRFQPTMTIQSLLAAQPSWWGAAPDRFDLALASYAAEHQRADLAAPALARAVDAAESPSGPLCAQAAYFAAVASNWEAALLQLERAETVGGDPLVCLIVQALVDNRGKLATIELPEVVVRASPGDLATTPNALLFMGEHALVRRDFSSAVDYLAKSVELMPEASSVADALARALLGRIVAGQSVVVAVDLRRAQNLAESALEQRRRWAGPSGPVLATLIGLQMMTGAYSTALQMATPMSLGGRALDQEAACGQVAVLGADAAMALGNRQRAIQFAGLVSEPWAAAVIAAMTVDPASPTADKVMLWRQTLAAALPPQELALVLSHLASLGAWPMPELDDALGNGLIDRVDYDILTARSEAARGLTDTAVRRLRSHALKRAAAAEILIDILADAQRYSEVADECDRAIKRFGGETVFIHKRLNALALDGQDDEAAFLANKILGSPATQPEIRLALRKQLVTRSAVKHDWTAVEEYCSAAIADGDPDADMRWGLIAARVNQGHYEIAWSRLTDLNPAVVKPMHAHLWINLHARFGFTLAEASVALEFLGRWPDDSELAAHVLCTFLDTGTRPNGTSVLPHLDPLSQQSLDAAVSAFTSRHPEGPIRPVNADPSEVVTMIRQHAIAQASQVDVAAERVRKGQLPLAALAIASRRSYTQVLVQRGCGFIPAVTANHRACAAEIGAAEAALGGPAVIELSALAVATLMPERWPALLTAFSELKLTRAAGMDLEMGRHDLMRAPGTVLSFGYDPSRDLVVPYELSVEDWQYLARRASELTDAATHTTLTDNPNPEHFAGLPEASPWLSSLELARQVAAPLWSDDVVIRMLAASEDIPTFGTLALLHVLVENGTLPDTLRADVRTLVRAGIVDLAVTTEELLQLAADEGWLPGSSVTILTRAAFWMFFHTAREIFLKLIGDVAEHAPETIPAWFAAACCGAAAGMPAAGVPSRLMDLASCTVARLDAAQHLRDTLFKISADVAQQYVPR